jgi:hypothetical protein
MSSVIRWVSTNVQYLFGGQIPRQSLLHRSHISAQGGHHCLKLASSVAYTRHPRLLIAHHWLLCAFSLFWTRRHLQLWQNFSEFISMVSDYVGKHVILGIPDKILELVNKT